MKKIIDSIRYKLAFLAACMLTGVYAYAQNSADTLSAADYQVRMPKHMDPFYNGPLMYIIFGVLIAAMIFVGYRYYMDNRGTGNVSHTPHNQ